jgi:chromosome segregation ATPase
MNTGEQGTNGADTADGANAETPPVAAAAPVAAPLSLGSRLAAAYEELAGRGDSARIAALQSQVTALTGERDALQGNLAAAQQRIAALEGEVASAQARVREAEAAVDNFEARVRSASIAAVAAAGIPAEQLPQGGTTGEDQATKLRAELAETTDPVKRGKIASQLLALRAGSN